MPNAFAIQETLYLGIDPGASGGLAVTDGEEIETIAMPKTPKDIWIWINYLAQNNSKIICCIEKVNGFMGNKNSMGSAMFNFGKGVGHLEMAVIATEKIVLHEAHPKTWMNELKIPTKKKGLSNNQWKNELRGIAQKLFPQLTITLATTDALLIMEYCRRVYGTSSN